MTKYTNSNNHPLMKGEGEVKCPMLISIIKN